MILCNVLINSSKQQPEIICVGDLSGKKETLGEPQRASERLGRGSLGLITGNNSI